MKSLDIRVIDIKIGTIEMERSEKEEGQNIKMRLIGGRYVVKTVSDAKRLIKFTKKLKEVGEYKKRIYNTLHVLPDNPLSLSRVLTL